MIFASALKKQSLHSQCADLDVVVSTECLRHEFISRRIVDKKRDAKSMTLAAVESNEPNVRAFAGQMDQKRVQGSFAGQILSNHVKRANNC